MKFILGLSLLTLLFFNHYETTGIQSKNLYGLNADKSFMVTFECNSCTEKNKFYISGEEEHTFKATKFPLKIKLKSGEYEMTYWQNRVQQIHLPFDVSSNSENIIVVKE